ncbi:hypothetical protein OPV22_009085 [Ensete ventricosum]|uniref:Secreted protein n=1 Tax=Ensete ventricosum TaxID=4639 RepID=A0AAV8R4E1_ENSVE|nr:hypothetical protein OPV22_009085 [Ensete ventricosum]
MMAARAVSQAPAVAVVFNAVTLAACLSFDGFSAVNSEDSSIAPSAPRLRLVSLLPKAMLKQEERRAPVEKRAAKICRNSCQEARGRPYCI